MQYRISPAMVELLVEQDLVGSWVDNPEWGFVEVAPLWNFPKARHLVGNYNESTPEWYIA